MWTRGACLLILIASLGCLLPALAQKADAPWKLPSNSELDNLIKKLKLPALRNKAPAPEDLPRQSEGDQTTAQDPATKRAVPINQYSDLSCREEDIVLPTSTEDVAAAVRYYYGLVSPYGRHSDDGNIKIRVASRIRGIPMTSQYREVIGMGERPGFSCPKGPSGSSSSPGTRTAVIATQDMTKVLHRQGRHVTVQAGITMTELVGYANANQLTLPLGTVPSYLDLTLGGLLAVGGHAQGPKGASNVADMVTHITFVDGKGKIHTVDRYCLEGRGLAGGLGMLGIITEVTVKLQDGLQKAKLWAVGPQPDTNIVQELTDMIERYDGRMYVSWRPDLNLVKYRVWEEVLPGTDSVPPETPELPTRAGPLKPETDEYLVGIAATFAALALDAPGSEAICAPFGAFITDLKLPFIGNSAATTDNTLDNVTALTNNIQGSDCNRPASTTTGAPAAGSCFFDPRLAQVLNALSVPPFTIEEAEFAVPLKDLPSVIADLRVLSALGGPCWFPSFIQLRPAGSTPDLIGPTSGAPSERFVWVELAIFRPNLPGPYGTVPLPPSRAQKKLAGLQEGFEQLMVCKYGARPHYGKMWSRVYASTECPIRDLFPEFHQQLKLQDKYDPAKLFESPLLSTLIAGGNRDSQFPGCSNEMQCYCSGTDAECGVTATGVAYKCQTAPAPLPPYKVCMP